MDLEIHRQIIKGVRFKYFLISVVSYIYKIAKSLDVKGTILLTTSLDSLS